MFKVHVQSSATAELFHCEVLGIFFYVVNKSIYDGKMMPICFTTKMNV